MNSAKKMCLLQLTTLIIIIGAKATTSPPIPVVDNDTNATTNYTKSPRFLNNNQVAIATGCFSSDTLVTLVNQQQIPIGQLRAGHQLLTTDGFNVLTTEMIMMLDQSQHSSAMFHTIVTTSGHKVSLTGLHLIAFVTNGGIMTYKSARDVKAGDTLRVVTNGKVHSSVVSNVTMEVKKGYYAPLTMSGTLLVNGVVASSFANVGNHELAQFSLFPLRWYYEMSRMLLIENPFGGENDDGIHFIPKMMYELTQSVYPSNLRLS